MAVETQEATEASEATEQTEHTTGETQLVSPGSDIDVSTDVESGDVDGSVAQSGSESAVDDSGIDDDLASLASSYGLNPAGFGSRANLENAIAVLDRQAASLVQQFQQQRDPETGRFVPGQGQPATQQQAQQQAAFDLKKLLMESFGGEYDEGVEKVLAGLNGHWSQQLQPFQQVIQHLPALVEKVQQFDQFLQAQQEQQATTELDQLFSGAGEHWKETFGTGQMSALRPHGPQYKARNAVVEEMMALDAADRQRGRQPSTRAQLFSRALKSLHPERTETIARKQVASQLKGNKNRALARPSQKTGQPQAGIDRAVARLNEWSQKRGLTVPDYDDE